MDFMEHANIFFLEFFYKINLGFQVRVGLVVL